MPGAGAEVGPGLYGTTGGGGGGAVSSVSNSDGTLTVSPTTGAVVASIPSSVALPGSPTTTTQAAGDNSTKIATDAFVVTAVNNAIAGVNPAVAVQAATTAAGDTSGFTYSNGVGGIGATFTGSVNTAVTIDGFTFTALGQRLLVKNDTQSPSGAFNGIYYVTQLQTGILAPVLTRALDYDSPSDMNNTGVIPVINGTVNGTTTWVLTSQVVTVGTTPLTYAQFSYNPSQIVQSFNTRNGAVTLSAADVEATFGAKGQILVGTGSGTGALLGVGSDTQVLTADSSQADGIKWAAAAGGGGLAIFGDGSDGAQVFDGTTTILGVAPSGSVYTQNRDWFLGSSTINNGVTIKTNGYRLFCQGTLTNNGTISWNGNAASAATGGGTLTGGGSISNTSVGRAGASGTTAVGANGTGAAVASYGGAGGHGGAGTVGAGGTGGAATVPTATMGSLRAAPFAVMGQTLTGASGVQVVQGGAGGGSGSGDSGSNSGGGGGGGGGVVVMAIKTFAGTGSIQARGGAGGNAAGGNTGGGGGGGGGGVVVVSSSVSGGAISGQTIDANGGSHGTSTGSGGGSIADGSAGTVILIPN